jgi:large subunit ribosomal protein L30
MVDEQTKKKVSKKKATAKKAVTKKAPTKKAEVKPVAAAKPAVPGKQLKVTLIKSLIGTIGHHRATVRGLGLRRLHHSVIVEDTPAIRGAVNKVRYLLRVEDAA